jgi:hypothetical protein
LQLLGNERASLCEGKGLSAKSEAQAASEGGADAIAQVHAVTHPPFYLDASRSPDASRS